MPVWGPVTSHPVDDGIFYGLQTLASGGDRLLLAYRGGNPTGDRWLLVRTAVVTGDIETWSEPLRLSSPTATAVGEPRIALSADGEVAIAAWDESPDGQWKVRASIGRLRGTSYIWSTPQVIDDGNDSYALAADISGDGSRAIVLWKGNSGLRSSVALLTNDTVSWAQSQALEVDTRPVNNPTVMLSTNGRIAMAGWRAYADFATAIRFSSGPVNANGQVTWAEPTTVTPTLWNAGGGLAMTVSPDLSTVILAWIHMPRGFGEVAAAIGRRSGSQVTWNAPETLSGGAHATPPALAINADGTGALAAWVDPNSESDNLKVSQVEIRPGGHTWSEPITLSDDGSAFFFEPSVVRTSGAFVVGASARRPGVGFAVLAAAAGAAATAPVIADAGIRGPARIGRTVRVSAVVRGIPAPEVSYRWSRRSGGDWAVIPGATGPAYRLVDADAGRDVRVTVTARNDDGVAVATAVIGAGRLAQEPIGLPPLPARLDPGVTVIAPGPVTTTAGQPVRIRVDWVPEGLARGDIAVQRVRLPGGGVGVYVPVGATGEVAIRIRAAATLTYAALTIRRTYSLG